MASLPRSRLAEKSLGLTVVARLMGLSLLVLIRQSVSDALLGRWCVLPFDGRSDGVSCSAKQVSGDLTCFRVGVDEETQSDPEQHLQHSPNHSLVV